VKGRTKDGNDATNPGVLKMVGMASNGMDLMDYLKHQSSSSFNFNEYDPTDVLKIPNYWLRE
jgi:hypothetical protein